MDVFIAVVTWTFGIIMGGIVGLCLVVLAVAAVTVAGAVLVDWYHRARTRLKRK